MLPKAGVYIHEEPHFDRWAFDSAMGGRRANTELNNAPLGASYYGRRPGTNMYAAILRILNRAKSEGGVITEGGIAG